MGGLGRSERSTCAGHPDGPGWCTAWGRTVVPHPPEAHWGGGGVVPRRRGAIQPGV